MLHPGGSITFGDPQVAGSIGATAAERETWKLSAVSYIPYATAVQGGADGDVASSLGADPLKHGDRYLVLKLTITDRGPQGMDDDFTLTSAGYDWLKPNGTTGPTSAYCMSPAPPGETEPDAQYASGICSVNSLEPGQSVTGYVLMEVPASPAVIGVAELEPFTALVAIDPDGLVHKNTCVVKAKFC